METWIIYTLISVFSTGLYAFGTKIAAERNYNTSLLVTYSYAFGTVMSGIYYLLFVTTPIVNFNLILFWAFCNALFYFSSVVTRIEGMKYIDTVIFFPIYKTIAPILVTLISFFYFSEILSFKDILGIILGIMVPLLLITRKESTIQKNLKLGLIFVVATSVLGTLVAFSGKQITSNNLNIELFIFLAMLSGSFMALFSYKFLQKNKIEKKYNHKGIIKFAFLLEIFHFIGFIFYTKALVGNLAIVFTINSFSILIPIILSIIFYKEHFNLKKGMVIVLSIISILLFI